VNQRACDNKKWRVAGRTVAIVALLGALGLAFAAATLALTRQRGAVAAPEGEPESIRGFAVDLGDDVVLEMVWIPPGEFLMGSPANEAGRDDDETQHAVALAKGFWMGKYEVTQAQWENVTGNNPSYFKGDPRLPVENVSWLNCREFLDALNGRASELGLARDVLREGEFRLPTEVEWEYACRAGTTTPYHFGENISTDQANFRGPATRGDDLPDADLRKTLPVGSFPANTWGLHDMHGNVWEWCEDVYAAYAEGSTVDVQDAGAHALRVLRGGAWGFPSKHCRSAFRSRIAPGHRSDFIGFRVVFGPAVR